MSESLATQYRFLSVFLAARNWGPLRFANTEPDPASPGRMVLLVIFPRGVEYNTPIYNEENAAAAYADIVEYQIRHGYNHVEFFDQGRVKLEIIYAGFHRRTSDLKRDLEYLRQTCHRLCLHRLISTMKWKNLAFRAPLR